MVQGLVTVLVMVTRWDDERRLGAFLVCDHAMMCIAPLVVPAVWVPAVVLAGYSLGVNAALLSGAWVAVIAAVTMAGMIGTAVLLAPAAAVPLLFVLAFCYVHCFSVRRSSVRQIEQRLSHTTAARAAAEWRASHDDLTGLANRQALNTFLADAERQEVGVDFLLVDLDDFKEVNDTLGHDFGDKMLATTAMRLRAASGPNALVARLGGDEFAVACPAGGDSTSAIGIAERIAQSLAVPISLDGLVVETSASIGIATVTGRQASQAPRQADVAMYEAKASRQPWVMYSEDAPARSVSSLHLLSELPGAFESGRVVPYFQADSRHLLGRCGRSRSSGSLADRRRRGPRSV